MNSTPLMGSWAALRMSERARVCERLARTSLGVCNGREAGVQAIVSSAGIDKRNFTDY